MNPIWRALAAGYSANNILSYMQNSMPSVYSYARRAMAAGYGANEIVSYMANSSNQNKNEFTTPGQLFKQQSDMDAAKTQKLALFAAATGLGGLFAGARALGSMGQGAAEPANDPQPAPNPGDGGAPPNPNEPQPQPNPIEPTNPQNPQPNAPTGDGPQNPTAPQGGPIQPIPGQQSSPTQPTNPPVPPPLPTINSALQKIQQISPRMASHIINVAGHSNAKDVADSFKASQLINRKSIKDIESRLGEPLEKAIQNAINEINSMHGMDSAATTGQTVPEQTGKPQTSQEIPSQDPESYLQQNQLASQTAPGESSAHKDAPKNDLSQNKTLSDQGSRAEGKIVILPGGQSGIIKKIENGVAYIDVNGEQKTRKVESLQELESNGEEVGRLYTEMFDKMPEGTKSSHINMVSYNPISNELTYFPHGSKKMYIYHKIPKKYADAIKDMTNAAKTTDGNFISNWVEGEASRGSMIPLMLADMRKERGKDYKYDQVFDVLFDSHAYPYQEAKKLSDKSKQKKEPKPKSPNKPKAAVSAVKENKEVKIVEEPKIQEPEKESEPMSQKNESLLQRALKLAGSKRVTHTKRKRQRG